MDPIVGESAPAFPPIPRLAGARVSLRAYRDDDADALFALRSDPEVVRYWSHDPWIERAQAIAHLERMRRDRERIEFYPWAIARNDDDRLIGTVALYELDRTHRRAMVGYTLATAWQGRGIAYEALQLMIAFAWNELDLCRLEADTDPDNIPSRRLLEKLGFALEGTMRRRWFVHGAWHDTLWYGLLRRDST